MTEEILRETRYPVDICEIHCLIYSVIQ